MAASAKGVRAGRAFVEIFADNTRLVRGLRAAQGMLQGFARRITGLGRKLLSVGGLLSAPLAGAVAKFTGVGAALNKLSTQTGASVESLSRLQFAGRQLGIDADDLTGSIEELQVRLGEAVQDGTGPLGEAFKKLGLDAQQLASIPLDERIGLIADALNGLSNDSDRQFLADEIFGGDAFKILPLLRQGADGIAALGEQSDRLGNTLSGRQADDASRLMRIWRELGETLRGASLQIGAALAPALGDLFERIRPLFSTVVQFVQANSSLIVGFAAGLAVLAAFSAAVLGVGFALSGVAALFGAVSTAVAFLASPIGLAAAALGGLVAWFATSTETGRAMVDGLVSGFGFLKDVASAAFQGIKDALAAGDFELAARILWLSLQAVWAEGVAALAEAFPGLLDTVHVVFAAIMGAWEGLKEGWKNVVDFVVSAWTFAMDAVLGAWNAVLGALQKAADLVGLDVDIGGAKVTLPDGRTVEVQADTPPPSARDVEARREASRIKEELAKAIVDARRQREELAAGKTPQQEPPSLPSPDLPTIASGGVATARRSLDIGVADLRTASGLNVLVDALRGRGTKSPEQQTAESAKTIAQNSVKQTDKLTKIERQTRDVPVTAFAG